MKYIPLVLAFILAILIGGFVVFNNDTVVVPSPTVEANAKIGQVVYSPEFEPGKLMMLEITSRLPEEGTFTTDGTIETYTGEKCFLSICRQQEMVIAAYVTQEEVEADSSNNIFRENIMIPADYSPDNLHIRVYGLNFEQEYTISKK